MPKVRIDGFLLFLVVFYDRRAHQKPEFDHLNRTTLAQSSESSLETALRILKSHRGTTPLKVKVSQGLLDILKNKNTKNRFKVNRTNAKKSDT